MQTDRIFAVLVRDYQNQQQNSELKTGDYFETLNIDDTVNPVSQLSLLANEPETEALRYEPSATLQHDKPILVQIPDQRESLVIDIPEHKELITVEIPDLDEPISINVIDHDERVSVIIPDLDDKVHVVIADEPAPIKLDLIDNEPLFVGRSLIEVEEEQQENEVRYKIEPIADVRLAVITKETQVTKNKKIVEKSTSFRL